MNYNPNAREKLRIILNNYHMFGLTRTIKNVIAYFFMYGMEDDFDKKYGVSTYEEVRTSAAGIEDEVIRANSFKYVGVREEVIRHILTTITKRLKPGEFTFIDLGCGKGRALIAASWFPFREIIGVEVSPLHTELAKKNINTYLSSPIAKKLTRCNNITVNCSNAADYSFPDANLLVYMYRPFQGPIFQGVLDNLSKFQSATGRRVFVAFCCPIEEYLLEAHPRFVKREEYQVISEEYSWNLWECC